MSKTTAVIAPSASAAATQSIDPNSPLAGYPRDNLKHVVITATCFAFILSTFSVGFRLISRKLNGKGLYLDDFFIVGALVGDIYLLWTLIARFSVDSLTD
jgi:hypothetical protein